MLRIFTGLGLWLIGNVAAEHPHFQCAQKAPFKANDWFEWANCEWTMEHPQKCRHGEPQRMMTCQVVCNEAIPHQPSAYEICKKAKIDLTFLVDGSKSVGKDDFQVTREFLSDVVQHLSLGQDMTHVSMIQYSDRNTVEILDVTDKDELLEVIEDMDYHDGHKTLTGEAISYVNQEVFMALSRRQDATPVFVVITDGESWDDVEAPIKHIHDAGIETIAIGVGSNIDMTELAAIASKPSNIHAEADYASLKKLQEKLTKEICKYVNNGHHYTTTVAPSTTPTLSSSTVSSDASTTVSTDASTTTTAATASVNPV